MIADPLAQQQINPNSRTSPSLYIYILQGGGSLGSIIGGQGTCSYVILALRECIWNVLTVSLLLPALNDTSSLGSPPHLVVYPPG